MIFVAAPEIRFANSTTKYMKTLICGAPRHVCHNPASSLYLSTNQKGFLFAAESPLFLSDNPLREELVPLFFRPRAGRLVREEAVPEHGGRDVHAVLAREFDCRDRRITSHVSSVVSVSEATGRSGGWW